jgi:hypothetical protein
MAAAYAGRERRSAQPSPLITSLAVTVFAGIVFVTLCPIGLRPHLAGADQERFGAWLVLGALVQLAAGRRVALPTAAVVIAAIALECAQHLAPGRHAQVSDALVKAMGGALGCATGQLVFPIRRWLVRAAAPGARAAPWAPEVL